MAKEKVKRNYALYVDIKENDRIVRKKMFDKNCSYEDAMTQYNNWKYIHDRWNGTDIAKIILIADGVVRHDKVYIAYDEEQVVIE